MIAAESSMQLGEGSLFALAEAIADGSRVDWDLAESSAGDGRHRRVVQQLRRLADLSAAARAHSPTWGPFTIRREIGGGTFGDVYRAWDPPRTRSGAEAAPQSTTPGDDPQTSRIARKAGCSRGSAIPTWSPCTASDVHDGRVGLWMELIRGRDARGAA